MPTQWNISHEQEILKLIHDTTWIRAPQSHTGPWPVRNKTAQQEMSRGWNQNHLPIPVHGKLSSIKLAPGARKCWRPTIQMKLESILLSKRSQTPKATCCMISHIWSVRQGNSSDPESRLKLQGLGEGEMRSDCWQVWGFSSWWWNVLQLDSSDGCASMRSRFSGVWLFATLWTVARQAPQSTEILQARILE